MHEAATTTGEVMAVERGLLWPRPRLLVRMLDAGRIPGEFVRSLGDRNGFSDFLAKFGSASSEAIDLRLWILERWKDRFLRGRRCESGSALPSVHRHSPSACALDAAVVAVVIPLLSPHANRTRAPLALDMEEFEAGGKGLVVTAVTA